jgi:hypothetical protein
MEPTEVNKNNTWEMMAFCDSDYAGDRDGRKSVSGFVIYILGCLISRKSRSQKSVTLSSTEAEYVAISELCAEIMFLEQVLEFLGIEVVLPEQYIWPRMLFLDQEQNMLTFVIILFVITLKMV